MNETSARPNGGNGKAIIIGILMMIVGAGLWAVITVVTAHEFSLVALGVAALVGLSMFAARPTSTGIAVVAALLTVIGCALGEFLAIPAYLAHKSNISFSNVINAELHHPRAFFDALDGKTYLFWALGAAAAFSMVLRRIRAARAAAATSPVPYGAPSQQQYAPPQSGPAAAPYPAQQPYGQAQPQAYGQAAQPYGPGQAPYGPGQPPAPGQPPYGGQPGPGQQYPPR